MEYFNKNIILCIACLAMIVLAVFVLWILSLKKPSGVPVTPAALPPTADTVHAQALTNGNTLITNLTAHYELIIPATWYMEKQTGSGITLYPDYDPNKKLQPTCKLAISLLQNQQSADLDNWLTEYLHADPTADVVESTREPSTISGHPAITWIGTLNGVSTTLAYISREDGSLYEIAPSLIEGSGNPASNISLDAQCPRAFQSLLSSFRIMP